MSKISEYRTILASLDDWDDYLRRESGLPGPRGNLELADAAASLGDVDRFRCYVKASAEIAPENTPDAYLVFVGVWGLGWQVAHGDEVCVDELRPFASDPRWRIREGAAIALQTIGDKNGELFRATTVEWAAGNRLEQRAAVAAVAEPRLLKQEASATHALEVVESVITSLIGAADAKSAEARVLRQALGYAWSVVIVAAPEEGKREFEALMANSDADARWIVRENLGKKRLERMDAAWVARGKGGDK